MTLIHRHRWLAPLLLLAPGLAWLAIFFLVPLGFLAYQSLQSGTFEQGYSFTWEFSNYETRSRATTSSSSARSSTPASQPSPRC